MAHSDGVEGTCCAIKAGGTRDAQWAAAMQQPHQIRRVGSEAGRGAAAGRGADHRDGAAAIHRRQRHRVVGGLRANGGWGKSYHARCGAGSSSSSDGGRRGGVGVASIGGGDGCRAGSRCGAAARQVADRADRVGGVGSVVVVVLQSVIPLLSDTDSHTTLSARVAWPPENTAGERQGNSHGRRAGSKKNLTKINNTGLGPE